MPNPSKCNYGIEKNNALFSRIEDIFETKALTGKTVTIIGLGSGGSLCADQLARCAVNKFRLVDFDIIEVHNIARHICGISDIGKKKTDAIERRLRDINPNCEIQKYDKDIVKESSVLRQIIEGSDIVLACTDNNKSRYLINESCLRSKVAAIYAGAYERAFGGFIMRVLPGLTPCYDCVYGAIQESLGDAPHQRKKIAYSEIDEDSEFKAEPGLCIDVHMIALIQAKMALLTLLGNSETTLEDFPTDFIFWGNRKEWIFPEPLYCKYAKTNFRKDCPTCLAVKLNIQNKAKQHTSEIISNAPYDPNIFR